LRAEITAPMASAFADAVGKVDDVDR